MKLLWIWIKRNAVAVIAVCAVLTLVIYFFTSVQNNNKNEEIYISKRPNVRIKSVYFKTIPYQASADSQSIALKFHIPIRNEGDTTAYNIEIKKKELGLVRGHFALSTPALQTIYTNSPFDLKPRKTIEDTIFIDESPVNMQQVLSGEKSFSLKYEIWFYADKNSESEPFVYEYGISFTEGQFQSDSLYENVHQKIKL